MLDPTVSSRNRSIDFGLPTNAAQQQFSENNLNFASEKESQCQ